ncbi:hypothetical protein TcWFU_005289 [Taenia crassiceps]|uniref:Uncharacterized protein n=1 Tax=Taenia crassiceps TaxID=6207 RepID=A0ABR4Q2N0_9CEST
MWRWDGSRNSTQLALPLNLDAFSSVEAMCTDQTTSVRNAQPLGRYLAEEGWNGGVDMTSLRLADIVSIASMRVQMYQPMWEESRRMRRKFSLAEQA